MILTNVWRTTKLPLYFRKEKKKTPNKLELVRGLVETSDCLGGPSEAVLLGYTDQHKAGSVYPM